MLINYWLLKNLILRRFYFTRLVLTARFTKPTWNDVIYKVVIVISRFIRFYTAAMFAFLIHRTIITEEIVNFNYFHAARISRNLFAIKACFSVCCFSSHSIVSMLFKLRNFIAFSNSQPSALKYGGASAGQLFGV